MFFHLFPSKSLICIELLGLCARLARGRAFNRAFEEINVSLRAIPSVLHILEMVF